MYRFLAGGAKCHGQKCYARVFARLREHEAGRMINFYDGMACSRAELPPIMRIAVRRKDAASVILAMDFEIALRVGAGGADFRRGGAHDDVAAIAAFPHLHFALGEDLGGFHIAQQRAIAFLMVLFDGGDQAEFGRQFREALFFGGFWQSPRTCPSTRNSRLPPRGAGFRPYCQCRSSL